MGKKPVPEVVEVKELYNVGAYLSPENRALFYTTYLTAGRISEVLKLRPRDIEVKDWRKRKVVLFTLVNLKNKKHPFKKIPVVLEQDPYETRMVNFIMDYLKGIPTYSKVWHIQRTTASERIRKLKLMARAVVKDKGKTEIIDEYEFKVYPHYLRHCRLTHLASISEMNLIALAGWRTSEPAEVYIRRDWKRIAQALI